MKYSFNKAVQGAPTAPDPYITEKKLIELKNKLKHLKETQPQAAADVGRLAQNGDFSENVEYQIAKGRLRGMNNAILNLEKQINQAVVIDNVKTSGLIALGSKVKVLSEKGELNFQILGSTETNPSLGVISHHSPLGSALLGHKEGDEIKINLANNKEVVYKVVKVE